MSSGRAELLGPLRDLGMGFGSEPPRPRTPPRAIGRVTGACSRIISCLRRNHCRGGRVSPASPLPARRTRAQLRPFRPPRALYILRR